MIARKGKLENPSERYLILFDTCLFLIRVYMIEPVSPPEDVSDAND